MSTILPIRHQPPLPLDRVILHDPPGAEAIEMDVLIVGAGPAGLACAIELARLVKRDQENGGGMGDLNIGVLEKAGSLGEHSLSGAVVNPRAFRELFPDLQPTRLPVPPARARRGGVLADRGPRAAHPHAAHDAQQRATTRPRSARSCAGWASRPRGSGVNLFAGLPGGRAAGGGHRRCAACAPRRRDSSATASRAGDYAEPTDLTAQGHGPRRRHARARWPRPGASGSRSARPTRSSSRSGVKEVWETSSGRSTRVIHTLGWPLPTDAFGGSFLYPLGADQVALGLVVGLDYHDAAPRRARAAPAAQAASAVPPRTSRAARCSSGAPRPSPRAATTRCPSAGTATACCSSGDAAGFVDVPSLKGIHYAMQSGIYAARATFAALKARRRDRARRSRPYDRMVDESYIVRGHAPHPEHAARVQGRVLPGRGRRPG